MDIIHGMDRLLPRLVTDSLVQRLAVMPVVVLTGARQAGKSTLVELVGQTGRTYRTLDDFDVLDAARRDPAALVAGTNPITLDEVQRAPELLHAVKAAVDRRREPGRFLLTGSANLLLMRRISETLAGRASYLTLWPMTRREQLGLGQTGIWDQLLSNPGDEWLDLITSQPTYREDWRDLASRGGFPTPAVHMRSAEERFIWFDGYVRTYLERDLQDLSAISALPDVRRLMRATALRTGQLLNQSELGRELAIPQATVHRYLNLLETSYVLLRLPAFSVNRGKRLVKTPKIYWADTGLAQFVAAVDTPTGAQLENLVVNDLLAWRDSRPRSAEIFHWRTSNGEEVDIVVETANKLLPIEVKSTHRPRLADTANLRVFLREYEDRAEYGLLLHDGEDVQWLAPNVLAAPWWLVV